MKAQYELGVMAAQPEVGNPDYGKAAYWFRLAAEQGHAEAQNDLGVLYAEGRGVERDLVQAYMWFRLATGGGNDKAASNLAVVAAGLDEDEIAEAELLASQRRDEAGIP